ncbi:MAG: excinuclease ABC subunit UvrC [Gammaproteobacteria bacterium]|nr:excinuclease ABC subunit UvrC [Gammaproteobacteria bacterium]
MTVFAAAAFLRSTPTRPGVYCMKDSSGVVIYVGKAKNLKNRLTSYFRSATTLSAKNRSMVAQIAAIEINLTHTEGEALLLENSLIKHHNPRYNILLRDDKSYPYIFISAGEFPRIAYHRGARREKGRYFGPYPGVVAVRESLSLLQKLFPVRQCEDSYYKNRTRPCLQYQIERCSAPCVGFISGEDYAMDVRHTEMFLNGAEAAIIDELVVKMEHAAAAQAYEQAARYRDQITYLRRIQESQYVVGEGGDVDIFAAARRGGVSCVQIFFVRKGQQLGSRVLFLQQRQESSVGELLASFIPQYYLTARDSSGGREIPARIIVNQPLAERVMLSTALSQIANYHVEISDKVRGERAHWLQMAEENVVQTLNAQLANRQGYHDRFMQLQHQLDLDELPQWIECFDISHTQGEATVASCVVYGIEGARRSDYRRFNISGITAGDDYAAMYQVLSRRFKFLKQERQASYPDLLLIDGGKGQLAQAEQLLAEMQIVGITLVGVAKGVTRKPGMEQLILSGRSEAIILPADDPGLHLIQEIRDEAHRFAITGHRQQRAKQRVTSTLEQVPGLGPKRRQLLLRQFGGLQEIRRAGVEDLMRVKGISHTLAQALYDHLH